MSTRKQFVKLTLPGTVIPRGSNTIGGTVIGDYINGIERTIVVEMPKVEKKAGAKKAKKPVQQRTVSPTTTTMQDVMREQEVTHGA